MLGAGFDLYLAEQRLIDLRAGKNQTVPLTKVIQRYRLWTVELDCAPLGWQSHRRPVLNYFFNLNCFVVYVNGIDVYVLHYSYQHYQLNKEAHESSSHQ